LNNDNPKFAWAPSMDRSANRVVISRFTGTSNLRFGASGGGVAACGEQEGVFGSRVSTKLLGEDGPFKAQSREVKLEMLANGNEFYILAKTLLVSEGSPTTDTNRAKRRLCNKK